MCLAIVSSEIWTEYVLCLSIIFFFTTSYCLPEHVSDEIGEPYAFLTN